MENKKVIKAGIGYTVGNYLLKGLNFLTIPIFSRLMSTADYGIYNSFAAYESIVLILLGLAIHTSYKNARYKFGLVEEGTPAGKDYYSYVSTTIIFLCICLGVWLLACNVLAPWLCPVLKMDRLQMNLMLLLSFSSAVITCFNSDASIRYQYMGFVKASGANALGNIALSLVFMCTVFTNQRYLGRMLGATIPAFAVAVVIVIRFLRRAKPGKLREFLPWGLRYSLPIVPHGISQVILSQFDRIMIRNMVSEAAAGIYSFAFNINLIITVTSQSLDSVFTQWFYEQMNQKNHEAIRKRSGQYMAGMAILTMGVILAGPELVLLLGSEKYAQARYCVVPIVASGFFAFMYSIPSAVEYYREKTKLIAAATVSIAVVKVVVNLIFIPRFGYIAAAYTTLGTYILYFLFHYTQAWRIEKKCLFSNRFVVISALGVLAAVAAALLLMEQPAVRWCLVAAVGILGIWLEERWLGFLGGLLGKLRRK